MKGLHNKPTAASDAKKSESVDSITKILKRVPTDMGLGTDMEFGADMGEMGASGLQGADVTAELMGFFQVQLQKFLLLFLLRPAEVNPRRESDLPVYANTKRYTKSYLDLGV